MDPAFQPFLLMGLLANKMITDHDPTKSFMINVPYININVNYNLYGFAPICLIPPCFPLKILRHLLYSIPRLVQGVLRVIGGPGGLY